ncbi:MAG: ATP synthase F1 subunit delta [Rickettsiales bacterium]|nr:ATP synthase F1 subunit delta [Rickettsiales bacterium]
MSNNSLNIIETSRRYAKAVILASANDKKKINKIKDDFESLIKLLKQMKELESFIETPLLNSKKKKMILKKIFVKCKFSQDFENFLITLTNHGKLFLIKKINIEFEKLLDEDDGILEVTVTTTEPMEKNVEEKIKKNLSEKLKAKIKLKKLIDKDIIGGIIFKINSIMIDNSIKSKLLDYNSSERLN